MKKTIKYLFILYLFIVAGSLNAQTIGMRIPDTSAVAGDFIDIPIYADSSLTGHDIYSYLIQLSYNEFYLRADSVITGGTIGGSFGAVTANYAAGKITLAGAGATPLEGSGVFLIIRFELLSHWGAWISFTDAQNNYFNEGIPAMNFDDGYVTIAPAPGITISPNSDLLLTGEQIQFTVSGDTTSPFQWTVENESVASIDENGLLTAVGPGLTKVSVTDSNNLYDETNSSIEVRGYALSIPGDLSQWQGGIIDIPVYTTDLTNLNVYAGNISISYNQSILYLTEIVTTGTLLDGFSAPEINFNNNSVNIAFATTSALSGEGILFYLRCNVSMLNTGSSYISFENVLFNEDLNALTDNGYFTTINFGNISISPGSATLFAGDSLQFAANGGVEPYVWITDDSTKANISSTGMLHALSGGTVHVVVEDSVGATKTSGNIRIYDTKVYLPDTTGPINASFDMPVYIDDLPAGQQVSSVEASFNFMSPDLEFAEIITTGTLTEGWTFAQTATSNSCDVAGAGTNGFDTSGILFFIRFNLTSELMLGENAWVYINQVLLNEGSPDAQIYGGSITGTKSQDLGVTAINSPLSSCVLTSAEVVNISVHNYGYISYMPGDSIAVAYQYDSNSPVYDTLILNSELPPSSTVDFSFDTTIDLSSPGQHTLSAYTLLSSDFDGNPSNNQVSETVELLEELPVELGPDQNSCQGESINLDAGEGYATYNWSVSGVSGNSLAVDTTGWYFVTVTDADGCQGSDSVYIMFNSIPEISLGNDTSFCEGYANLLDAGSGFFSYNWNNGLSNDQTLSVVSSGSYFVEVTDYNGCIGRSDTISISVLPSPIIELGNDTAFCDGYSATLSIDPGFSSYLWSTGETTNTISASETGTYVVEVTGLNGCSSSDSVSVEAIRPPLDLGEDVSLCSGESYILNAPWGTYTYQWSDGTADTSAITINTTGNYAVTVTDTLGCVATDTIYALFSDELIINITADSLVCLGDTITLFAGTGFDSYTWSNGGSVNEYLEVTQPGSYAVTVTSGTTCQGSDTIEVSFLALPTVDIGPDVEVCGEDSVTLIAGTGYATYNWNNGLSTTDTLVVYNTGTYFVEVSNDNSCKAADTAMVTVNALPIAYAGEDVSICYGDSIDLTASGGSFYYWNTTDSSATITVQPTETTSYFVTVTENNCSASDSVQVDVLTIPEAPVTQDVSICYGQTIPSLTATGENLQWYADSMLTELLHYGNYFNPGVFSPGSYTYYVTSFNGNCESQASMMVFTIWNNPDNPYSEDVTVCLGNPIPALSAEGDNIYWYADFELTSLLDTGNVYVTGQQDVGVYTYYMVSQNGICISDINTVILTILEELETPVVENVTVCYGENVPEFNASSPGTVYWYSDAELTNLLNIGPNFGAGITEPGVYQFYATQINSYCESTPAVVSLTINSLPDKPVITQQVNTLTSSEAFSYQWLDADMNEISGATAQSFDPPASGFYYVRVANTTDCFIISDAYEFIKTGVNGIERNMQVQVYPNPVTGSFKLHLSDIKAFEGSLIELINMNGVTIIQRQVNNTNQKVIEEFDISNFAEGLYLLKITTVKGIKTLFVQKQ